MNRSQGKHLFPGRTFPQAAICPAAHKGGNLGNFAFRSRLHIPGKQQITALAASQRPQFNHIIGMLQHMHIMVHQNHRVAITQQAVNHIQEPFNVGRMQADTRLIEYVKYSCGFIAHSSGQLHALTLTS